MRIPAGPAKGRNRTVRSMVGELHLRQSQAEQLGVKHHSWMSGLLEKACLRLSANESFQDAEADREYQ